MRSSEAPEEVEQGAEATNAMSARTILVVEDDNDVRAYTVEIIRELGYHVLEATTVLPRFVCSNATISTSTSCLRTW